jgi:very-short-patch-repair endonuclease
MSSPNAPEGAETDTQGGKSVDRPNTGPKGPNSIDQPISGVACSFEHPRTAGDAEIAWLAGRQQWCIHRRQLLAAGIGRKGIQTRLGKGVLHPFFSDVYLWGNARPEPMSLAMGAVLHLRGDALVSGAFATWVWGMFDERPPEIEVLLIGRNAHPLPGVVIHRTPSLDERDIRRRNGLPITAPARALIEVGATESRFLTESALAMLRRKQLASDKQVREALDRVSPTRPGVQLLRRLLELPAESLAATKSRYERKLRKLLKAAGLPVPLSNHRPEGIEVDLCWPEKKLIVEFDGWEFHKEKFKSDRRRDAYLQARGWKVMRFTADDIDMQPYLVIAQITAALTLAIAA